MRKVRFRSAITGEWVSKLFAKKNPDTTVSVTVGTGLTGQWSKPLGEVTTTTTGTFNVSSDMAPCPFCRKDIPVDATLCPHCQSEVEQ